jgi:hypothetical protein
VSGFAVQMCRAHNRDRKERVMPVPGLDPGTGMTRLKMLR